MIVGAVREPPLRASGEIYFVPCSIGDNLPMIYVIRHGECTLNAGQVLRCKNRASDLTERGREQARLAGLWLADKDITHIYASPFDRALQTADTINQTLKLPAPTVEDGLSELDCGDALEDVTYDEGLERYTSIFFRWLKGDFSARFEGGEDFHAVYARFSRIINRLDPDENTLVVTHGGVSRAVIPLLCVNVAALKEVRVLHNTGFALLAPYDHNSQRFYCDAWDLIEHLS